MVSRRELLKAVAAGMAVYPFKKAFASQKTAAKTERILNMYNIHTEENLNIKYYSSGVYDRDALNEINYFLRCHYTNEVINIDVRLLDLLCDIQSIIGRNKQIEIISGYRTVDYNEYLRSQGRKVSKNSLHLNGQAIDFAIHGVSNYKIFRTARSFAVGGVGHYPEFIHIDTGRIRYW
jgi:uncharacterized protein YcbK (DUF882 family)